MGRCRRSPATPEDGGHLEETERETQTQTIYEFAKELSLEEAGLYNEGKFLGKDLDYIIQAIPPADVPHEFRKIYVQYVLSPSAEIPYTGDLPKPDGYPGCLAIRNRESNLKTGHPARLRHRTL